MRFLSNNPLGLHLQKVTLSNFWILKKFKTNFLIQIVKHFNLFCYNGCRKRKIRRKKIKIKEEVAERFKAADCKFVRLFLS